ncbi:MAG TPA: response regulator, partial [Gemmatimonadales bacterium]
MTLRALIVDDEAPARELLCSFVAAWTDIDIVGDTGEGAAAVEMIRTLRPDLVFLDVQMPVMNGFDVVAALEPPEQPLIVFVTAYDQYALRAFDVSACDYLLKPFDAPRLRTTIDRVLQRRAGQGGGGPSDLAALLKHLRSSAAGEVVVKADGTHHFLRPDDIVWIEAMGKSVRVHLVRSTLEVRESLSA